MDSRLLKLSCSICNSERIHYAFKINEYDLNRCEDCGFMFVYPQPNDDVLRDIYNHDFLNGNDKEISAKIYDEQRKHVVKNYISQLLEYIGNKRGRLLEIGCKKGEFLQLAKDAGFEVNGIEVSKQNVDFANKLIGSNVVSESNLEELIIEDNSFDVCVIIDTLQQVRNPDKFLKQIHKLLKKDGVIFTVMPSLDSKSAKKKRKNWFEFKTQNINYFDSMTIQNAFAKNFFNNIIINESYKYLSLEYIKQHYKNTGKSFKTALVSFLTLFFPGKVRKRFFKTFNNSICVCAKKAPIYEFPKLSIVIPVYNEKNTVRQLIELVINKELPGIEKEIIIVESNSKDGTKEIVQEYEKKYSEIRVVYQEKPCGKGNAVREGFEHATGNILIIQDGDMEYDINDYDILIEPIVNHRKAFILGSRHSRGFKMREFDDMKIHSTIMNVGHVFFTFLINWFCSVKLKDPFTMYKVFRKDCLYGLKLKSNRFEFDWELVIKLIRKGYIPEEIPINYKSRSFSEGKKVSMILDPLRWIKALFKYRFGKLYEFDDKEKK